MTKEKKKKDTADFFEKLLELEPDVQMIIMAKVDALHELQMMRSKKAS